MAPYHFGKTTALAMIFCCGCQQNPVIHATRKQMIETVYASGKITPVHEYSQSALCTGTIVRKLVKDGDTIKKGQLLYLVSNDGALEKANATSKNYAIAEEDLSAQSPRLADLSLALQNAQIKLTGDSLTYHRWKTLWEENIGTRSNLDNCYNNLQVSRNEKEIAEQRYLSAKKDLQISRNNARSLAAEAQKSLNDYSIRSDRDGVVYQTFKESGESVRNNEVVALLGEQGAPLIRLAVDQQDIGKIKPGQSVLIQADATGNTIYEAAVIRIYPVMNDLDQTFRVDAHFTASAIPSFIHGSAEANIVVQQKQNVLVLPHSALLKGDSVTILEKRKRRQVQVTTGIRTPDEIEIISGITEMTNILPQPKTNSHDPACKLPHRVRPADVPKTPVPGGHARRHLRYRHVYLHGQLYDRREPDSRRHIAFRNTGYPPL
ncbi:efflux RND transporter periplasmic adaptor subunit [Puia sp. P3]|uniref:efflux RND transporter periplasmic adaptor subunit n=1 Tax=Puia sp. P3 TaxID=3423952 RepID=UPI003D66A75A